MGGQTKKDVVTDPSYSRIMTAAKVLITPWTPIAVQASLIRPFLAVFTSPVPPLFTENKLLPLPFLSHLSTKYLLIIMLHALNNGEAAL